MEALSDHFFTADDTDETGLRIAAFQGTDQAGTEDVPRCLAGDHGYGELTLVETGWVGRFRHRKLRLISE